MDGNRAVFAEAGEHYVQGVIAPRLEGGWVYNHPPTINGVHIDQTTPNLALRSLKPGSTHFHSKYDKQRQISFSAANLNDC